MEETKNEEATITLSQNDGVDQEKSDFSIEGLLPQEVELAKKHGLVKDRKEVENGEHEEQPKSETVANTDVKKEEDKASFEEVEKNEELLSGYSQNAKALYYKWKVDKKKRQEYQRQAEELRAEKELNEIKATDASRRLERIKEALQSGQELTVEQLLELANNESKDIDDSKKQLTVEDLRKYEEAKEKKLKEQQINDNNVAERYKTTEEIGRAKHQNFEELVKLAEEVTSTNKLYKDVLSNAFLNKLVDEDELVDMIHDVARLNPKFKEGSIQVAKGSTSKEAVEKAVKNSEKKISSASVPGSKSNRTVSESQLTVADASKLSTSEWMKLKPETKKRLLMGIDP